MKLSWKICCLQTFLALIVMAVTHCQAQTATEGFNSTACTSELKNCSTTHSQPDKCTRMTKRVECYAETADNGCNVDETVVSFEDIMPTFTDICYGMNNVSCWALTNCLINTDYNQLDTSISFTEGPNQTQSDFLTSTAFWCTYLRQSMDCVERHTEGCGVGQDLKDALTSRLYWLVPTCDGLETSVSSQCRIYVTTCFRAGPIINGTESCQDQLQELKCVNNSRNHGCIVRELNNVTFDSLANIHPNVCEVVNPVAAECSGLRECMVAQYYGQIPAFHASQGPPPVIFPRLLASPFWCQHLNQTVNCFLREASQCNVTVDDINHFRDTVGDYISKLCSGQIDTTGGFGNNGTAAITPTPLSLLLLFVLCVVSGFSRHHR